MKVCRKRIKVDCFQRTRKRIYGNGSPESPDRYQICFHHSYLCFVLLLCLHSDIRCLQVHLNDTVITCSTFLLNLFSILKKEFVALALPLFRLQPTLSPSLLGLGAWGLQMPMKKKKSSPCDVFYVNDVWSDFPPAPHTPKKRPVQNQNEKGHMSQP